MLLFWPAVQGVGAFTLRHQTRFCDILCLDYVETGICCHAGTAMIVNKIIKDKPLDKQVKKTCCWDSLDECVETLVLEYLPSRQRNLLNQVNHHFHQLVVSSAFSREVILESLDLESRGLQSRELWFHIIQYCMRRSQFITRLSIRNCRGFKLHHLRELVAILPHVIQYDMNVCFKKDVKVTRRLQIGELHAFLTQQSKVYHDLENELYLFSMAMQNQVHPSIDPNVYIANDYELFHQLQQIYVNLNKRCNELNFQLQLVGVVLPLQLSSRVDQARNLLDPLNRLCRAHQIVTLERHSIRCVHVFDAHFNVSQAKLRWESFDMQLNDMMPTSYRTWRLHQHLQTMVKEVVESFPLIERFRSIQIPSEDWACMEFLLDTETCPSNANKTWMRPTPPQLNRISSIPSTIGMILDNPTTFHSPEYRRELFEWGQCMTNWCTLD